MIAIVDCNSFYCSCEKVFRPDLEQAPIVVLSNNDGCIISRNDAAKDLGVGMGGPYFQEKALIEKQGISVFSSNYNLYGDLSRRVMEVMRQIAGNENVEVYSVDEAFIDCSGFDAAQLRSQAEELRDTIARWTGIRVSIGIAPTKTLAKLANRMAKKNKEATGCISILQTDAEICTALKELPVHHLWGVGNRYADKLRSLGILTGWDLRQMPEEWAKSFLGGVVGVRLIRELRGVPSIQMKDALTSKKMIATTRMFGQAVTELKDIQEAVATYTTRAAEKLRRQQSAAAVIGVFLTAQDRVDGPRFRHGPTASDQIVIPVPSAQTQDLIKPALRMAASLFEPGRRYKKAGVILSGLIPDTAIQSNLFEEQKNKGKGLMEMLDNINFSMRNDMVKFASSGTEKNWKMRQEFHSPRYTTRWDELVKVH